jgi:hypothetical protein
MATRVRLVADPTLDALYPEDRPIRVTLELADGSQTQAKVIFPKGNSSRPLTRPELHDKALGLMRAAWGDDDPFHRIRALLDSPPADLPQQLGRVLRRGLAPWIRTGSGPNSSTKGIRWGGLKGWAVISRNGSAISAESSDQTSDEVLEAMVMPAGAAASIPA